MLGDRILFLSRLKSTFGELRIKKLELKSMGGNSRGGLPAGVEILHPCGRAKGVTPFRKTSRGFRMTVEENAIAQNNRLGGTLEVVGPPGSAMVHHLTRQRDERDSCVRADLISH